MAVEKVKKVAIFGSKEKKDIFLKEAQKRAFLHFIDKSSKDTLKTKDEITSLIYKIEIILPQLEKELKEGILEKLKPVYVSEDDFFERLELEMVKNKDLVESIWAKIREKEEALSFINEKKALLKEIYPWKSIYFSQEELKSSRYTIIILGKIPVRFYEECEKTILSDFEVELVYKDNDFAYVSVILLKEEKEKFYEAVKKIGFEEVIFQWGNSPLEEYESLEKQILEKEKTISHIEKEMASFRGAVPQLRLFYDYLVSYREKNKAEKTIEKSDYSFKCEAWINEKDIPRLEKLCQKIGEMDFEEVELEEGEVAPIYLKNNSLVSPFEFVTQLYSPPKDKEADPTPFLAPFFALFLATWLTDAGYSLFLVVLSYFALKKFRLTEGMQKLFKIVLMSGILGIPIGFLAGGFWGIDTALLSETNPLRQFMNSLQILNPASSEGMMQFLKISMGFGFAHILLGFILKFIYRLKDKKYAEAFLDVLPWIAIMLGSLGFLEMLSGNLTWIGKSAIGLMILGGAVILLFAGRDSSNIVVRFFSGLYALYGVTGIFGDVLSYARLFAGGLSTGIIAGVVNKLALDILGTPDFSSFVSILLSLLSIVFFLMVLIGGHIFNIAMNVLGGFIHTARLQFVEFFGKFFEGGGEIFTPLGLKLKYFLIKQKENKEENI